MASKTRKALILHFINCLFVLFSLFIIGISCTGSIDESSHYKISSKTSCASGWQPHKIESESVFQCHKDSNDYPGTLINYIDGQAVGFMFCPNITYCLPKDEKYKEKFIKKEKGKEYIKVRATSGASFFAYNRNDKPSEKKSINKEGEYLAAKRCEIPSLASKVDECWVDRVFLEALGQ